MNNDDNTNKIEADYQDEINNLWKVSTKRYFKSILFSETWIGVSYGTERERERK